MADTIKIGNLDISAFKVGSGDCKVYLGDTLLYSGGTTPPTPPTPTGSTCYEVISTPITSYTSTTYDSVYSFTDAKWYMKNNLSQYEEYGIYDIVENISSATTYEGKLGVVGTTEYQYSGGSWNVVGTYEDASTTYEITDEDPSPYVGETLSTTFKIPYADVQAIGLVNFYIRDNNDGELHIMLNTGGMADYAYWGGSAYQGTVTNDGGYFYLSLPSEAPSSIVIGGIDYWDSTPIHLIAGSKQASVEYEEKDMPLSNVYNTVADMELDVCPTVGINQYGVVGNDAYQFDGEDWNSVSNYKLMEKNTDGKANVLACNSSTDLLKEEAQPSYFNNITYVEIGDCVTSIGEYTFYNCSGLTSCTIGSSVTSIGEYTFYNCSGLTSIDIPSGVTSIGEWVFYNCTGLTSIDIPSGVTSIGSWAFQDCSSLSSIVIPSGVTSISNNAFAYCSSLTSINIPSGVTSISNNVFYSCSGLTSIDIPSGVTSIGNSAFNRCISLSSITINATTPPTLGSNANAFDNTNDCPIYVPCESVNAYKSATNWSTYSSRIQAIPNS